VAQDQGLALAGGQRRGHGAEPEPELGLGLTSAIGRPPRREDEACKPPGSPPAARIRLTK
jgi:hypothetical protein